MNRFVRTLLGLLVVVAIVSPAPIAAQDAGPLPAAMAPILPGDQVSLRFPLDPQMNNAYRVDANGEAVLPWLGPVRVSDHTAGTLPAFLREAYAEYLRDPSVEVIVLRRVGVQGEVRRPDIYMVDLTTSVRDLIAMAGGVTEAGDPARVELLRGDERTRLRGAHDAELATFEVRSGDHIIVGRRPWAVRNMTTLVGTTSAIVSLILTLRQFI